MRLFYQIFLLELAQSSEENICATKCFRPVAICRLNAKKFKRKTFDSDDSELVQLLEKNHWDDSVLPNELIELKYDKETLGGCGNCNPKRERAKYNGRCPCCEECKRCLNHGKDESADFNACCDCVGLCGESESRRRAPLRYSSEEISTFHFDVDQKDQERFSDVTDDAILTDILHFDVYKDEQTVQSSTRLMDIEWKGPRKTFMHECMELSDCSIGCQAMGAGMGRWFPISRQSESGCCECLESKYDGNNVKQPMCRNCQILGQL